MPVCEPSGKTDDEHRHHNGYSELVTFEATGKDTGGAFVLVELVVSAGGATQPE